MVDRVWPFLEQIFVSYTHDGYNRDYCLQKQGVSYRQNSLFKETLKKQRDSMFSEAATGGVLENVTCEFCKNL